MVARTKQALLVFSYRAFDNRWLYWERDTKLLDEKRANYRPHILEGNMWIEARTRDAKEDYCRGTVVRYLASDFGNGRSHFFPTWLREDGLGVDGDSSRRANLTEAAHSYLKRIGLGVEDLFHHVLATLHDPAYRSANAGALRMELPRIPLPGWPKGKAEGAAADLVRSAARGCELAALLDPETPVPGVTQVPLRQDIAAIAVPATLSGRNMADDNFAVTAGWGHCGQGDAVMPGQGRAVERAFSDAERAAMGDSPPALGETTIDIYLNGEAFWRNVPAAVWTYRLGGYQVLKKWLSYRERDILGRSLRSEEVQHFANTARRIGAILILVSSESFQQRLTLAGGSSERSHLS